MIRYVRSEKEDLAIIRPMWEALNQWHREHSRHFGDHFQDFNYDMRLQHFMAQDHIFTLLAYDGSKPIGYSVATIKGGTGEIESLYLDAAYRGRQIGEKLMTDPIAWMEDQGVKRITLGVSVGNEGVMPFYSKFGFYPRTTILERKKGSDDTIEERMYQRAKTFIEKRYPKGWGGAGVVRTHKDQYYISVAPEGFNPSVELCIETGAILEAHKYKEGITHCLCLVRDDEKSPYKVLTPCGVCQERLRYFGPEVLVGVTAEPLTFKPLKVLQPYHWTGAYDDIRFYEDKS